MNPLLKAQQIMSKRPTRPEPVTPVMERYAGENFPWRGTQDHGVEPPFDPADPVTNTVDVTGRPVPVKYEPLEKDPDPIPVRIVQDSGREYRQFWTDRRTVTDGASSVLGRDNNRITARITNMDTTKTVYVGSNFADLDQRGYPLAPGKELPINGEMPVFIRSSDNTAVTVGIYVETVVPENHA